MRVTKSSSVLYRRPIRGVHAQYAHTRAQNNLTIAFAFARVMMRIVALICARWLSSWRTINVYDPLSSCAEVVVVVVDVVAVALSLDDCVHVILPCSVARDHIRTVHGSFCTSQGIHTPATTCPTAFLIYRNNASYSFLQTL